MLPSSPKPNSSSNLSVQAPLLQRALHDQPSPQRAPILSALLALCQPHRQVHCSAPWMKFTREVLAIPLDCRLPRGRQVCFRYLSTSPHAGHLLVLVKVHLIGQIEFIASGPCTQRKLSDSIINHCLKFALFLVLPISVNMPSQTPGSHL